MESGSSKQLFVGLDLHDAVTFVPVQGVAYVNKPLATAKLLEILNKVWPAMRASQARLLLLIAVLSAVPHLRRQLTEEGTTRHVILADAYAPSPVELRRSTNKRARMVMVSHAKRTRPGFGR